MTTLRFTVDSALLTELGERLVGKPYIALGELVKNSYDADASKATIEFAPEEDRIEVRDDGHGMDFRDFERFWMRIGTPHKDEKLVSKYLKRPMTGSKGVGRLAVQLLAGRLTITTVPKGNGEWLEASVNWADAVQAGDLVDAVAEYTKRQSSPPFEHGTRIILTELRHEWSEKEVRGLAAELWRLQPPFRSALPAQDVFEVDFESTQGQLEEAFEKQNRAILRIWMARVTGRCREGRVSLSLEFAGESPKSYAYSIADFSHNAGLFDEGQNLNEVDFEIRIFRLVGRQRHSIKLEDAKEYLFKYGGVHVYDGGFRLPYYGSAENDWLRIEFDHSHRRFVSELLPKPLQAEYLHTQRLRYLPTLGRVFGVVNVNTAREPNLEIMITRDRLTEESTAFRDLVTTLRYAFDLYAYEEARRRYEAGRRVRPTVSVPARLEEVEDTLELYEKKMPAEAYHHLAATLEEATKVARADRQVVLKQMGLLGPLATAGMSALAFQHELRKQFSAVEDMIEALRGIKTSDKRVRGTLVSLGEDLSSWLDRARATNALFDYLGDAENLETRSRFNARGVIEGIKKQTQFLARGIEVDLHAIDDDLLLPEASLAEWTAVFQNVFTNGFNAMVESERRLLEASSRAQATSRAILVQDTGVGVDLETAEELFEPFERRMPTTPQRRALGYGGTGLGLTIVRLVADRIGCTVGFVQPDDGFSTAFSLSWRETK